MRGGDDGADRLAQPDHRGVEVIPDLPAPFSEAVAQTGREVTLGKSGETVRESGNDPGLLLRVAGALFVHAALGVVLRREQAASRVARLLPLLQRLLLGDLPGLGGATEFAHGLAHPADLVGRSRGG